MVTGFSLDLHHEIEMLKASLSASYRTVNSLKSEIKGYQEERTGLLSQQNTELTELQGRYERSVASTLIPSSP